MLPPTAGQITARIGNGALEQGRAIDTPANYGNRCVNRRLVSPFASERHVARPELATL